VAATDDTKEPLIDPERDESLNILADLIDLSKGPKTAASSTIKKSTAHQQ